MPVDLEGQAQENWYDQVQLRKGNEHAKLERPCLHIVKDKNNNTKIPIKTGDIKYLQ